MHYYIPYLFLFKFITFLNRFLYVNSLATGSEKKLKEIKHKIAQQEPYRNLELPKKSTLDSELIQVSLQHTKKKLIFTK